MNPEYLLFAIFEYSIQIALLVSLAFLASFMNRNKFQGTALWFWQAVLGFALLLPLIEALPVTPAAAINPIWGFEIDAVASSARVPASGISWEILLISILAAGVVFSLGKLCLGLIRLKALHKRAVPLEPLPEHLSRVKRRLQSKCSFLISTEVSMPVTFGLLNPVILVPEEFLGLNSAQQECIACHELLHVSRRDWLLNLGEQFVKSLFWFHPAIHLLIREINLTREALVDSRVVGITGKRQIYLKALWKMVQPGTRVNAFLVVPFAGRSQLLKRVRLLSREVEMPGKQVLLTAVCLSILAFSTVAFGKSLFPIYPKSILSANALPILTGSGADEDGFIPMRDKPVNLEGSGSKPELIKMVDPKYPSNAGEARVTSRILVDKEGNVKEITIIQSPDERLSQSTIDALKQWKYQPFIKDGETVEVTFNVTFNLGLKQ